MRERLTTGRFETTQPDEDALVLTVTHFTSEDHKCLFAGENPSMAIDRLELCHPDGVTNGSIEIITGDTTQAILKFRHDKLLRLEQWLDEHAEDKYVTIYDNDTSA